MVCMWVAGKTVCSPCYTVHTGISECFRDQVLHYKALCKFTFFFTFFYITTTLNWDNALSVVGINVAGDNCRASRASRRTYLVASSQGGCAIALICLFVGWFVCRNKRCGTRNSLHFGYQEFLVLFNTVYRDVTSMCADSRVIARWRHLLVPSSALWPQSALMEFYTPWVLPSSVQFPPPRSKEVYVWLRISLSVRNFKQKLQIGSSWKFSQRCTRGQRRTD